MCAYPSYVTPEREVIAGVSPTDVHWKGFFLGEPPIYLQYLHFFFWGGGGGGGRRVEGGGGQGGWEWRSEAFVKIQKKKFFGGGGGGGGGGRVRLGRVRVDGNGEVKLL